ncbi:MAG: hypothetical protein LKI88_00830 [Bifidobacterium sp.]|jgi:hypothetical protein|nr:hypothetical protein [Bifidobacterium sp.]MCI1864474.1 hypothetical protein [Bifidobacterium sp.]
MVERKKPADHKPAKGDPISVTSHGVTVSIDPAVFDDMILLTDLRRVQREDDPMLIVDVCEKVFADQYQHVLDSLRNGEGRVPAETFTGFLADVMGKAAPNS